jgi:hypothetical protein
MPWLLGVLTDLASRWPAAWMSLFGQPLTPEQFGLRAGILVTGLCPVVLSLLLRRFRGRR